MYFIFSLGIYDFFLKECNNQSLWNVEKQNTKDWGNKVGYEDERHLHKTKEYVYVPCTLDNDYNNIYRSSSKLNQEECKQKQQNTTTNTISIHPSNGDDDDDDEDIHPTEA